MQCSNIFEGELVEVIEGYSFSHFVLLFYTDPSNISCHSTDSNAMQLILTCKAATVYYVTCVSLPLGANKVQSQKTYI